MKLRIKGTNNWGEVIGSSYIDNPHLILDFKGQILEVRVTELTDKTIKQIIVEFLQSVYNREGSLKNQIIFTTLAIFLGFLLGLGI